MAERDTTKDHHQPCKLRPVRYFAREPTRFSLIGWRRRSGAKPGKDLIWPRMACPKDESANATSAHTWSNTWGALQIPCNPVQLTHPTNPHPNEWFEPENPGSSSSIYDYSGPSVSFPSANFSLSAYYRVVDISIRLCQYFVLVHQFLDPLARSLKSIT
ncbi:MAG: hypothetical protein Q9170_005238 [Blastenia crenularia]